MNREQASARIRIDLWKDKVRNLRHELQHPGRQWILLQHVRSELRIYGSLFAGAVDDLVQAESGDPAARDSARKKYWSTLEELNDAWVACDKNSNDPLTDKGINDLERASDVALLNWIDS